MTLGDLRPGQRGMVIGFSGAPPVRLMELGIVPGTFVEVVRFAPLGDPIDVRIRQFHLSLRRQDALMIEIKAA